MSFKVNLWAFSKEANSTAQPTGTGAEYTCVSNDDLDVLSPRIPLNIGNSANPSSYNYCKIPDFGRYYWIRTWKFEAGLWVAYCQVDPLASWKTGIGSTSAYVLRAAAASDGDIVDNMYPGKSSTTEEDSTGTSPWNTDPSSGTFVVGIVGSGATQYIQFDAVAFDLFLQYILTDAYALAALGTLSLATNPELKVALDPLQYISSIVWMPLTGPLGNGTAVSTVRVGYVDVPVAANSIGTGVVAVDQDWNLRRHPLAATRGAWLNAAMGSYTLRYPPFGLISIDPVICANSATIKTTILVDLKTGHASLVVFNDNARVISRISGQVGLPYQVGQVVAPGYGLTGMLSDVVSIGTAAIMENGIGIVSGTLSAIGNIAKSRIPSSNTVGGVGGIDQLRGTPALQYEWTYPLAEDNTHRGRPLCAVRTLSTLSGYQLCTNVDLSIPATREEIDMVRQYLESGYYYE